jgi:glycosyltransferase involved in cell wall biosynthesis
MNRKIILFGPLPPPYGGVAIYLRALVARLRGPNVRVWTYTGAPAADNSLRLISHRKLGTVPALFSEGRNARILDASHFHLEYPNALLLPAWLLCKQLLGFEWFKNILDGSLPKRYAEFGWLRRRLFHSALAAVDEFVVVSDELRRWLQEELRVEQRVTVVPCLLPAPPGDRLAKLSRPTETLLEAYLAHEQRVCSIGVFFPSYGFKHVADAVAELRARSGKDIGLLLLDGGFVCDQRYREATLRDRDWITVLEKVPNPEINEILARSSVFVRAFGDESYGISRVEALWAGVPVIATRAGETRGMLLYDFGDLGQLVNQLQMVLLSPGVPKLSPWAARYRAEAEENLATLATVLGVEPRPPGEG